MAVALPSFDTTFCQMVGVCSLIKDEASLPSLPAEDTDIVSSFRTHSGQDGKAFVRLVWEPEIRHFHVDVARRSWFGKASPKADTSIATFRKTLASFDGVAVAAQYHSSLLIPLTALPASGGLIFVGDSGMRLSTGQTEIDLTGATLTFRRSHIRKIRWDLVEGQGVVLSVDIKRRDLRVSGSYLTEALELSDSVIATYILGRKTNDKSIT